MNEQGGIDGGNASDPGIGRLASIAQGRDAKDVVLVGTGPVPGCEASPRWILDIREHRALAHARPWVEVERAPEGTAAVALVWPRAHLGKDFAEQCIARAGLDLRDGGELYCAIRKRKGADSIASAIERRFGHVRVVARDRGYRLLSATRLAGFDADAARACLAMRYEIRDPALGGVALWSAPGVFARQKLDAGTRALIAFASDEVASARCVLDLCCGIGPLAIWAAARWPEARVLGVDSNLLATSLARVNAQAAGVADRVEVRAHDGLEGLEGSGRGEIDLALVNPPTHADGATLRGLLGPLRTWCRTGAQILLVASRPVAIARVMSELGMRTSVHDRGEYGVIEARTG